VAASAPRRPATPILANPPSVDAADNKASLTESGSSLMSTLDRAPLPDLDTIDMSPRRAPSPFTQSRSSDTSGEDSKQSGQTESARSRIKPQRSSPKRSASDEKFNDEANGPSARRAEQPVAHDAVIKAKQSSTLLLAQARLLRKQMEFRQTALPVCITLAVTLPILAAGYFQLDADHVVRTAGLMPPVALLCSGLIFGVIAFAFSRQSLSLAKEIESKERRASVVG